MNDATPLPFAPRPVPVEEPRRQRPDQAFLPAALEIIETPPSPVGIWLIWIICLLAATALVWSYFGRLDVVAVAQGKIQPTGRVKVIQPLEAGRVERIGVENGQSVHAGDVLVRFDSGEADADVQRIGGELAALSAEAARRTAALAAVSDRVIEPIPAIDWPPDIPPEIKARETAVLAGDLGKLASTVASLDAQLAQKRREQERYGATALAMEQLVATLRQRVDMRASLLGSGSGSKADLIDATETLQEQEALLATARGQAAESIAAVEVLARGIEDSYRTFIADNLQKRAEAERGADDDRQQLAKAELRQGRTVLRSPIDGSVSALSLTTVGQVVGAGEEIMRIVPSAGKDGSGIEIEAYLQNRDIGFVRPGQEAVVKIESLPFTRYGTIEAKLVKVASDAIPQPDADQVEGNPIRSLREQDFAGASRTQNLVFPATFELARTSVLADGAMVPLSPGMAVTVEIKTGSRRILEYLFSPLVEVGSQALRER